MPTYQYMAVNQEGRSINGVQTAKSRQEVLQMLKTRDLYPVKINDKASSADIDLDKYFNRVSMKDLAVFCRQFHTMLKAGVNVIKCLYILSLQTNNTRLKKVVNEVYEDVQRGASLSDGLKAHRDVFPDLLINMIHSGEESGTLDTVMGRMATHYEKDFKLRNKVKGAMIYPIVLAVVSILVVTFLLIFIMPQFIDMFTSSGVELPGPTKLLLAMSSFLTHRWYVLLGGIAVFIYVFHKFRQSDFGREFVDNAMLTLPVIGKNNIIIICARFTRTLSTLLSSGMTLIQAMEIVAKVMSNTIVAKALMNAREEMRKGLDFYGSIRRMKLFPPMLDSMIRIGEESGNLDAILDKTADFYDEEAETALQKIMELMQPALILVMAGLVAFIVISIAMPMFDMMKTVQ